LTSHTDPKGRPTVFSALPAGLPRLISVGRLDLNSEGLLLLTNDGALSRALELPSNAWVRRYRARAFGETTQEKLDRLKDGITVEGVRYGSIEAKLDKASGRNIWITLTLAEGKNREVRRVLEALGLKVNRLIRLSYGPFALGTLGPGEVEEVGPRVIREQLAQHIAPQNLPKGDGVQWRAPKPGSSPAGREESSQRRGPKPQQSASRTTPADGEQAKKKTYKAGWAKAGKPKVYKGPKRPSGPGRGGPSGGPRSGPSRGR
jgi:23S rRNA pseudouridine2605 synthase